MKLIFKLLALLGLMLVLPTGMTYAKRALHAIIGTPASTELFFIAMASPDETEFQNRVSSETANLRDEFGATPLCYAARFGKIEHMKLLLRYGAEVNATSNDGRTALMFAASEDRAAACRLLIERGADVTRRNQSGKSAYDLALQAEAKEVAALLRDHGSPDGPTPAR